MLAHHVGLALSAGILAALVATPAWADKSASAADVGTSSVTTATASTNYQPPPPVRGELARRAFDRLKELAGDWQGESTKGWKERENYSVIANGSCVLHSSFDAHPNERMLTLFHLDGDTIMLTHYCVARNQPRLRATQIADDLSTMTFEFLDATNLPSRDRGHMDKLVLRFESADRFTSRWTWYQDGKEDWMEEIVHDRVKDAPNPNAAKDADADTK